MKCGEVHRSIQAWRKLSSIPLEPLKGLRILRYMKLVTAEYDVIEKQRVAIIRDIAGVKEGEDVYIEPKGIEYPQCVKRINELMNTNAELAQIRMSLDAVAAALDGKENVLSVADLAALEPFFQSPGDAT